ncbi:MAG: PTS sugar transporter subunit IIA [Sphaerochaetaceae bacterium]
MLSDALIHSAVALLSSTTKESAIREVISSCSVFHSLCHSNSFIDAVLKRELLDTTGIGHGIGIAHGNIAEVTHLTIGMGISKEGVQYYAKDGKKVHILFVIASSPQLQKEYLRTLSTLLRIVYHPHVREDLLRAITEENHSHKVSHEVFMLLDMLETQRFESYHKDVS